MASFTTGSVTTVTLGSTDTIVVTGAASVQVSIPRASPSVLSDIHTESISTVARLGPYGASATLTITGYSSGSYDYDKSGDITPSGPILLSAAQIASSTAAILADTTATYIGPNGGRLNANGVALYGANWGRGEVMALPATFKAMLALAQPQLEPIPLRTAPYKITGSTFYVDPVVAGPGTGTFADPYKAPTSATLAAGDGLLFKAGTTTTIAAAIAPAVTGTSIAPIIFGVYDGTATTTNKRKYSDQGGATITCGGAAIKAFNLASKSFICIDGLTVTNNSGANALIDLSGTSASCQIINNVLTGGADSHINCVAGLLNVIEGNNSTGATSSGIIYQPPSNDANIKINFNRISGAVVRSLLVYGGGSDFTLGGTIACNTILDAGAVTQRCGIEGICGGSSLKIFRNVVKRVRVGISIYSSITGSTVAADMSGQLIENNEVSNCEYNCEIGLSYGSWVIQYNKFSDAGSFTGAAPVSANKYGRNIEVFGATEASGVRDGTIRFNYCSGAYNWVGAAGGDGSEGIGIGLDNNSTNISVYGNYCTGNEGVGILIGISNGCRVFGNVCYDNNAIRTGNAVVIPEYLRGEITMALAPNSKVFNNTCVQTGRTYQKYGFCDSTDFPSKSAVVFNNLFIGATTAGVRRNTTAGAMVESYNVIAGPTVAVVNTVGTTITNGTNTILSTTAAIGASGVFWQPKAGGPCDGTGNTVASDAVTWDGICVADDPPIGALKPVFADNLSSI